MPSQLYTVPGEVLVVDITARCRQQPGCKLIHCHVMCFHCHFSSCTGPARTEGTDLEEAATGSDLCLQCSVD